MSVTLKELAELCGCSIRTVSRALSHSGPVAAEKQLRIEELARRYHYNPNMAARSLRTERRCFVGVIAGRSGFPLFIRKLHDLAEKLEARSFHPVFASRSQLQRTLSEWAGMVRYLIFPASPAPEELEELLKYCESFEMKIIVLDGPPDPPAGVVSLRLDRSAGIVEAIGHLVQTGHRRILRCGTIASRDPGWGRAGGLYKEVEFLQLPAAAEGPEICRMHADAVFFDTDRAAAGFLGFAVQQRMRLPEELSVIGFDDESYCPLLMPALSSIAHPIEAVNAAAALLCTGEKLPADQLVFPTRFILRDSVRSFDEAGGGGSR